MATKPLLAPNVRREARECLVGWTLAEIGDLFHDHGFSADTSHDPGTSGQRRTYVEQFYVNIDWNNRDEIERLLGVFEAIIDAADDDWAKKFVQQLARDGINRDASGRLRPRWFTTAGGSVDHLSPDSAIPILLERMWSNVEDDPDAGIRAAKEAIEATAKHLLANAGEQVSPTEKMPALIARAQKLLDVHPQSVAPTKEGADTIKAILGSLSQAALGVNALRRDDGTGHGRAQRHSGLNARHARLAAEAAAAWVRFMLDTEQARSHASTPPITTST